MLTVFRCLLFWCTLGMTLQLVISDLSYGSELESTKVSRMRRVNRSMNEVISMTT